MSCCHVRLSAKAVMTQVLETMQNYMIELKAVHFPKILSMSISRVERLTAKHLTDNMPQARAFAKIQIAIFRIETTDHQPQGKSFRAIRIADAAIIEPPA